MNVRSCRSELEALDRFMAVRNLLDAALTGHLILDAATIRHLAGVLQGAARFVSAAEDSR